MEDPNFLCPINQTVMLDPVMTCDGHTYERKAIENWFRVNPRNTRSPCTNAQLANKTLTSNIALKKCIQDSQAAVGSKRISQEDMQAAGGSKRAKTPDAADPLVPFQRLMLQRDVTGMVECWRALADPTVPIEMKVLCFLVVLTDGHTNSESAQFVASGGVQLVVDRMTTWRVSTAPQIELSSIYSASCGVLRHITRASLQSVRIDHMLAIEQAGGIEAVVLALQEHCGNVHLVKRALGALQNFADIPSPATVPFAHKIIDAGCMQAVAMKAMV